MRQYQNLVREILESGTRKENRTGVDSLSTFGHYYEHDLAEGFPLLTTKAMSWKNIVVENLWFLSGEKDISVLQRHGCKFWDAWADERGEVPSAYGNFWRHFPVHGQVWDRQEGQPPIAAAFNDQIAWVLEELRRNPMSRRLVVSAWAPGNAQTSKLPPCHCLFVLNVQNLGGDGTEQRSSLPAAKQLCLHLTQRSCDTALGVPYNIAGYALLLQLFARLGSTPAAPLQPGIFGHTLVDAHIYTSKPDGSMAEFDHVPGLKEQLTRSPHPLPRLVIDPGVQTLDHIQDLLRADTAELLRVFHLEGYEPHPAISFKVAV